MPTSLFDNFLRTDMDPSSSSEPIFDYLNRTARPAFVLVRKILDIWFNDFPADGREEFKARFRSSDGITHSGSFFELYCHALLLAQGFTIELHPDLKAGENTHPDFLVSREGESLCYFEVTHAMPSTENQAARARDAQLNDAINRLELPDFFVNKLVRSEGSKSLPTKALRKFLKTSAASLDPDNIEACHKTRFAYCADDWEIEFSFIPRNVEARVKKGVRTLGITTGSVRYQQAHEGIRSSLKKKASKYGGLELPYIIAINCLHHFVDYEDCLAALFGDEQFVIPKSGGTSQTQRKQNGFWWGPKGYQNTRVSAVLLSNQLVPWTVGSTSPELWHNPFASQPFDSSSWSGPQYVPNDETQQLEFQQGTATPDLLNTRGVSKSIRDENS